jgi:hypothetical protein
MTQTILEDKKSTELVDSIKSRARITGALFIIATAASILSLPFLASTNASNYLASVSANGNLVITGALLVFVGGAASASIAISMYPVLRKYHESLALGAVGFRLIEGALYVISAVGLLLLVTLGNQFVNAGAPGSSYYQTLGALVLAGYRMLGNVGALSAFCIGGSMYYFIFYTSRLVPRWLSGWGLLAVSMCFVAGMLVMFGFIGPMSAAQVILALPIAVQEMVLAVLLIVKGFNPAAFRAGELAAPRA